MVIPAMRVSVPSLSDEDKGNMKPKQETKLGPSRATSGSIEVQASLPTYISNSSEAAESP